VKVNGTAKKDHLLFVIFVAEGGGLSFDWYPCNPSSYGRKKKKKRKQ